MTDQPKSRASDVLVALLVCGGTLAFISAMGLAAYYIQRWLS